MLVIFTENLIRNAFPQLFTTAYSGIFSNSKDQRDFASSGSLASCSRNYNVFSNGKFCVMSPPPPPTRKKNQRRNKKTLFSYTTDKFCNVMECCWFICQLLGPVTAHYKYRVSRTVDHSNENTRQFMLQRLSSIVPNEPKKTTTVAQSI